MIVVLAIIALIAVPIVLNIIEKSREGAAVSSARSYVEAVETYVVASELDKTKEVLKPNETYEVDKINNLIEIKGTKPASGNISISDNNDVKSANLTINGYVIKYDGNNYSIEGKDDETQQPILYKETILNGTDPILKGELVPVTLSDNGEVTYADLYSKWYSYEEKKWANAVILKDNQSKNYKTGDIIKEEDIESYFVWIPKYSYKIFDLGNYDSAPSGTVITGNAKTIDIRFGTDNTIDTELECATPLISGEKGNCAVGKYMTQPSFITMNTNGLWIGKFETGYKDATSIEEAEVNSSDSSKIIIKPNVYSWRNNIVSNMFISSYNYKRELDSHMMKNTEWAAAYLSHSIYGINKEVTINSNGSYLTGYSNSSDEYNTVNGSLASTTGNITGIYDMNGGVWEYMASYIRGNFGSSNFTNETISNYNDKYFDIYSESSNVTTYGYRILGDATGEIGPFVTTNSDDYKRNQWYGDGASFINPSNPWFERGGYYNGGLGAGQFDFYFYPGDAKVNIGSRLVLVAD